MLPLKEATSEKHRLAEQKPFNVRMFRGLLTKEEYAFYLYQELQIFQVLDNKGLPHTSLKRTGNIQADLAELKSKSQAPYVVLGSTADYVDYLASLTDEQALPHIYLNYMAIMFGGQMIRKSVPSTGRMYDFDQLPEAIQSIRRVQKDEWAEEVNKGFDFNNAIFDELETANVSRPLFA